MREHNTDEEDTDTDEQDEIAARANRKVNGEVLRKGGRRASKRFDLVLSKQFKPRFLADADSRIAIVRTIRRKIELLKQHTGADSYQKEILCERAVFVAVLLETAETKAMEGEPFDLAAHVQGINCMLGLLKSLGLEKKIKRVGDLKSYLEEQEA